jgi:nucleoside-diphosphate-sugar epimerase
MTTSSRGETLEPCGPSSPNTPLPPERRPDMEKDRVVLTTGAAGGTGTLFAKRFLTHGDTVIAADTVDEAIANEQEGK